MEIIKKEEKSQVHLMTLVGNEYNLSASELKQVINATLIKPARGRDATDNEIIMFLSVCRSLSLNPFLGQIYAFPNKSGGISPIVGYHGCVAIAVRQPDYFKSYQLEGEITQTANKKDCPAWVKVVFVTREQDAVLQENVTNPDTFLSILANYGREFPIARLSSYYRVESPFWREQPDVALGYKAYKLSLNRRWGLSLPDEEDDSGKVLIDAINVTPQGTASFDNPKQIDKQPPEPVTQPEPEPTRKRRSMLQLEIEEKLFPALAEQVGQDKATAIYADILAGFELNSCIETNDKATLSKIADALKEATGGDDEIKRKTSEKQTEIRKKIVKLCGLPSKAQYTKEESEHVNVVWLEKVLDRAYIAHKRTADITFEEATVILTLIDKLLSEGTFYPMYDEEPEQEEIHSEKQASF